MEQQKQIIYNRRAIKEKQSKYRSTVQLVREGKFNYNQYEILSPDDNNDESAESYQMDKEIFYDISEFLASESDETDSSSIESLEMLMSL